MESLPIKLLENLNALAGGLFLLCAFGMVATRQVRGCLHFFIAQALFLAMSAFILGALLHSWDVLAVGVINVITKPFLIPWVLQRNVRGEMYSRREIDQLLNIPTSLLIALARSTPPESKIFFPAEPGIRPLPPEAKPESQSGSWLGLLLQGGQCADLGCTDMFVDGAGKQSDDKRQH